MDSIYNAVVDYVKKIPYKNPKKSEWVCSENYRILCEALYNEADEIRQFGLSHLNAETSGQVVRTEVGSKSDLHRGFYCPSPVYDIFVGNAKRGKLLKRLTTRSNQYYIYGFDMADRLVRAERYVEGTLAGVEHIYYSGPNVYGIELHQWGVLRRMSKETYCEGKLISYCTVLFLHTSEKCDIVDMTKEQYVYDDNGLAECCFIRFIPCTESCRQTLYQFQRKDGLLHTYTASDVIGVNVYEKLNTTGPYDVFISRKA